MRFLDIYFVLFLSQMQGFFRNLQNILTELNYVGGTIVVYNE